MQKTIPLFIGNPPSVNLIEYFISLPLYLSGLIVSLGVITIYWAYLKWWDKIKILPYYWRLISSNFWIAIALWKLNKLREGQVDIKDQLKKVEQDVTLQHSYAGNISETTSFLVKENILHLQNQQKFHFKLELLIQSKIRELKNKREEIFLLYTVILSILKAPNPHSRLDKLESIYYKFVNYKITNIITRWQKQIKRASKNKDLETAFTRLKALLEQNEIIIPDPSS